MYPCASLPFKNQAGEGQHPPLRAAEAVVSSPALRVIGFARGVEMIVDWTGCVYEAAARSSSWMGDANEGADHPLRGGGYLAYEGGEWGRLEAACLRKSSQRMEVRVCVCVRTRCENIGNSPGKKGST